MEQKIFEIIKDRRLKNTLKWTNYFIPVTKDPGSTIGLARILPRRKKMVSDKDRPDSGRFSEEAPGASLREPHEQEEVYSARQESEQSKKQREFSGALQEADQNAQQAGRTAARKLVGGFLQGIGKRGGEFVWDILTGNLGS